MLASPASVLSPLSAVALSASRKSGSGPCATIAGAGIACGDVLGDAVLVGVAVPAGRAVGTCGADMAACGVPVGPPPREPSPPAGARTATQTSTTSSTPKTPPTQRNGIFAGRGSQVPTTPKPVPSVKPTTMNICEAD